MLLLLGHLVCCGGDACCGGAALVRLHDLPVPCSAGACWWSPAVPGLVLCCRMLSVQTMRSRHPHQHNTCCSDPRADAALAGVIASNNKVAVQADGLYAYIPGALGDLESTAVASFSNRSLLLPFCLGAPGTSQEERLWDGQPFSPPIPAASLLVWPACSTRPMRELESRGPADPVSPTAPFLPCLPPAALPSHSCIV